MGIEDMVKQVTEMLEKEGNSKVVFGELVKLDTHNIIPVATVEVGGGGGGTNPSKPMPFVAGGGGMALKIKPVGFIQERNGEVVFTPIHVDVTHKPFLNEASTGLGKAIDAVLGIVNSTATKMLDHKKPAAHV